jgi:hypothetical protein
MLQKSATSTTCNKEYRRKWDVRTRPRIFLSVGNHCSDVQLTV